MRQMTLTIAILLAAVSGCTWSSPGPATSPTATSRPVVETTPPTSKPAGNGYLSKGGASNEGSQTAVEKALDWAAKYEQAMQNVTDVQKQSRQQMLDIQALQADKLKLQAELTAAQKELKDANSLLIEMRQELTKWKADVLGFRGEMKEAQQAQIDMLTKVIKLLGAEAPATKPTASQPTKEPASEPTHN